jgi:hypothetical protein
LLRHRPLHQASNRNIDAFPVGAQRVGLGFPVLKANFPSFNNREVRPKTLKFVHKFGQIRQTVAVFADIPVYFPVNREIALETGSHMTAHTTIHPSQTVSFRQGA